MTHQEIHYSCRQSIWSFSSWASQSKRAPTLHHRRHNYPSTLCQSQAHEFRRSKLLAIESGHCRECIRSARVSLQWPYWLVVGRFLVRLIFTSGRWAWDAYWKSVRRPHLAFDDRSQWTRAYWRSATFCLIGIRLGRHPPTFFQLVLQDRLGTRHVSASILLLR